MNRSRNVGSVANAAECGNQPLEMETLPPSRVLSMSLLPSHPI